MLLCRSHLILRSISWLPHLIFNYIGWVIWILTWTHWIVSSQSRRLDLLSWPCRVVATLLLIGYLRPHFAKLLSVITLEEIQLSVWACPLFKVQHICWLLNRIINVLYSIRIVFGCYILTLSHFISFSWISVFTIVIGVLVQTCFGDMSVVIILLARWVLSMLLCSRVLI